MKKKKHKQTNKQTNKNNIKQQKQKALSMPKKFSHITS